MSKLVNDPPTTVALGGALTLLQAEGLPVSDLSDAHLEHFFFDGSDGSPSALVGLESYGSSALLRSRVVSANARARGTGSALVQHAQDYAVLRNVRAIYLLTTTPEAFFERLGYRSVDRTCAPPAIRPLTSSQACARRARRS